MVTRRRVRQVPVFRHRQPQRQARHVPAADVGFVPNVESLTREIASDEDTSRFYFLKGEVPHSSKILRDRSRPGQALGELYDDMITRDTYLGALLEKRWKAVLGRPRSILPADETPAAVAAAEFCRAALAEVSNFDVNLLHQLQAISHGWSAEELIWELRTDGPLSRAWIPDLVDRPLARFVYLRRRTSGPPELHVRRANGKHVRAEPGKFLVRCMYSKDLPWGGTNLLDRTYWYHHIKMQGLKYWSILVEKWAQPTAVGRYQHTADVKANSESVARLLTAMQRIKTEYGVALPEGLSIDLLEAQRGGEVSYGTFISYLERGEALAVLGEVDTSGLGQGPGSYAKSVVSNDVRLETLRIDAHSFDSHMTDHLLWWITRVNLPEGTPVPFWHTDVADAEALKSRREGIDALYEMGLPVVKGELYRTHSATPPREGEEVVKKNDQPEPAADEEDGEVLPFQNTRRSRAIRLARQKGIERYYLEAA